MKKLLWYLPFIALYFVPKAIDNEEISILHCIATAIVQGVYLGVVILLASTSIGIYFGLAIYLTIIALMIR